MTLILNSSDWHADWVTAGVDRYDDVAEAVAQTVWAARAEKVDLYLFTGDLSDPDDGPRALRAVKLALDVARELRDAGIPSAWVAGNHDVIEDGGGRSTLTPLAAMGAGVTVFDAPGAVALPGRPDALLVALPYPPASRPYDASEVLKAPRLRQRVAVVAGHMTEVTGVEPGEESLAMNRGRGVPFPFEACSPEWLLVNGHVHLGQTFRTGPYTLYIPGSLVRLNHGEERVQPHYLILET
jgi:DNA repair exonuclease SbcCD nuclease subunit